MKHYQTVDPLQKESQVGRGLFGLRLLILHFKFQFSKSISAVFTFVKRFVKPRSRISCSAFGLFIFFFKPRSRRLGGFLLCLRFIYLFFYRAAVGVRGHVLPSVYYFFFSFVGDYIQTSADDDIIRQLQAISQLFSSHAPSGEFC